MGCAATGCPLMVVISTPCGWLARMPLLAARAEKMRQPRGSLRALRLLGGQKDEQVGIAAAQPRNQLAVAQNHFSIGGARKNARRRFRIFFRNRQDRASARPSHRGWPDRSRPTAQTPASPAGGAVAQLAQQIDRSGQRELRRAQPGDKISAANAAALFERLQHVVHRAESAGHIFRRHRVRAAARRSD